MSVEKNLGTLFYSQKIIGVNYDEKLRNQNKQKKNKKEVLP